MLCPVCTPQPLQMAERQGIQIGSCPQCGGVWLQRAALDALVERADAAAAAVQRVPTPAPAEAGVLGVRHRDTRHLGQRGRKKRNWLAQLFDA